MTSDDGHGHAPAVAAGPVPARVRRLLAFAVAPLLLATVVGLIVLWPGEGVPDRPANLGALIELETATVTGVEVVPCSSGPQAVGRCQRADMRIT
ncbi:MAG TPA: hypothetical protein VF045_06915, partial [Acidimicrobiales bacterium]